MPKRLAVLASGSGSNLQALLEYFDTLGSDRAGDVNLVASDHPDAGALRRADARGIATAVLDVSRRNDEILELLHAHETQLVVLAGYLRLVPAAVIAAFRGRILNVHPALLPAFGGRGMYGERVQAAVIASGARLSGATVHFVDEAYDHGPIIAQWPVPVVEHDTPADLAKRVLAIEHVLYPRAVQAVAADHVYLGPDGRVHGVDTPAGQFAYGNDIDAVRSSVDAAFTAAPDSTRSLPHTARPQTPIT